MTVTGWCLRYLLIPIIAISLVMLPVASRSEDGRLDGYSLAVGEDQATGEEDGDNFAPFELYLGGETLLDLGHVRCTGRIQGPQIDIDSDCFRELLERGPPRG